jgi:hypothetical protein
LREARQSFIGLAQMGRQRHPVRRQPRAMIDPVHQRFLLQSRLHSLAVDARLEAEDIGRCIHRDRHVVLEEVGPPTSGIGKAIRTVVFWPLVFRKR